MTVSNKHILYYIVSAFSLCTCIYLTCFDRSKLSHHNVALKVHAMESTDHFLWNGDNKSCWVTKRSAVGYSLTSRLRRFNEALEYVRLNTLIQRDNYPWSSSLFLVNNGSNLNIIRDTDDVVQRLASYPGVKTAALRWVVTEDKDAPSWSSLYDASNLLIRNFFPWTGDARLCDHLMKNVSEDVENCMNMSVASHHTSLEPSYIDWTRVESSVLSRDSGVVRFMKDPYIVNPKSMLYLHIFSDVIITDRGNVVNGEFNYVPSGCEPHYFTSVPRQWLTDSAVFLEVFVISQPFGGAVYHRLIECIPRVAPFVDFLRRNPHIKIHESFSWGAGIPIQKLLSVLGIDGSRLISGVVRATIAYVPPGVPCMSSRVQDTQLLNSLYRAHIRKTFPEALAQHRMILIKRSNTARRFVHQEAIEKVVTSAALDFNLTYTLFDDQHIPSFEETVILFHSAVMVVAPHGAGESNIIFAQPGTYVIEGVCHPPFTRLCFSRLAHILGQHWHGIMSRQGCQDVVDVDASDFDNAMRNYLHIWQQSQMR